MALASAACLKIAHHPPRRRRRPFLRPHRPPPRRTLSEKPIPMHTLPLPSPRPPQLLSPPPRGRSPTVHPTPHFVSLRRRPSPTALAARFPPSDELASPADDGGFDAELGRLLVLLPEGMRRTLGAHSERRHLIEVVMDLGRRPLARFPSGDSVLSDLTVTFDDLRHAISQVGDFSSDNRAGISRTLHRISAIRNRKGTIVGLTCRVGRAVSGSANLLSDLVMDGGSLLLLGPPGVGKTTIIREISRMLADDYKKRVMIVDTSNEIGGDGDIPHGGIGGARRMQVPNSEMQHKVLIEAVENHMPQVIVIDEIGTKLEAMAASTIAQRGIQLVATAHGVTFENLVANPSLEMLVGGVQSVTLGDEEASRRGGQKTVLERKGPSTFTCGVEIISKMELRVHRSLEETVDALLSGQFPKFEIRKTNNIGNTEEVGAVQINLPIVSSMISQDISLVKDDLISSNGVTSYHEVLARMDTQMDGNSLQDEKVVSLYVYGILEASVEQVIMQLGINGSIRLTDNISEADGLLALQSKFKKNTGLQAVAKSHDIPTFVTKTSSLLQIRSALRAFMSKLADGLKEHDPEYKASTSEKADALEEARLAVEQTVIPKGEHVELLPRSPIILSLQMDLIKKYKLQCVKVGEEPYVRLLISPLQEGMQGVGGPDSSANLDVIVEDDIDDISSHNITRLPLLPD